MTAASWCESSVAGSIEGKVIEVTEQGDLVTDIDVERLQDAPRDERVSVRCDEHETLGIFELDHSQPPFTLLAVIGSQGRLELRIVDDSARIMLGVGEGTAVSVKWQ